MRQSHQETKRSLTTHYCLYQAAYFVASAGIGAFGVTYLMDKGFAAAQIGAILALVNILSCILQPMIGSYVDRRSLSALPGMILRFLLASFVSMAAIELLRPALSIVGLLFLCGSLCFSITVALSNSLCAYYSQSGYRIDYGMGAGIGSLSFSFASLGIGYIIAWLGTGAMMLLVLLFMIIQMLLVLRYPRISTSAEGRVSASRSGVSESLSILGFCRRYRFFMLTMLGVMCLSACHAMAENYMIQMFSRIGGGSENVGTALFIACTTAAPFLLFFERIQKKTGVSVLMRLSGIFFICKAVLLVFAPSILSIYLIELLQTCTYGFLYPSLYYFSRERIAASDMVKGQAIASALYTLGAALGNSLGGAAIDRLGLSAMLTLAAIIAGAGTLLINATIGKADPA